MTRERESLWQVSGIPKYRLSIMTTSWNDMIGAIGRGFAYFGTFIQWKLSPRLPNVPSQIVCHQAGGRNISSLKEIDEGNKGGYKNLFQGPSSIQKTDIKKGGSF